MEKLIDTFLFGKGIEKFKVLFKFYLLIASAWIANICLLLFNVDLYKILLMKDLSHIFFSPEGIVIFFVFIVCFVFLSFYGKIISILGSFLMNFYLKLLIIVVVLIKFIVKSLCFQKYKLDFSLDENDKIEIVKSIKIVPELYRSILSIEENDLDNGIMIFSFFSSVFFIFHLYGIEKISILFYWSSVSLSIFYFLNSCCLSFVFRKKDRILELDFKSQQNRNEPNTDNKPNS